MITSAAVLKVIIIPLTSNAQRPGISVLICGKQGAKIMAKNPTCPFCGNKLNLVSPVEDGSADFHQCLGCGAIMKAPDINARVAPKGYELVPLNGTDIMTSILKIAIKNREELLATKTELDELKAA